MILAQRDHLRAPALHHGLGVDLVAWGKTGDLRANGFDGAGEVRADDHGFAWLAQAHGQPSQERIRAHDVPVGRVEAARLHPYRHLAVVRGWALDVLEP